MSGYLSYAFWSFKLASSVVGFGLSMAFHRNHWKKQNPLALDVFLSLLVAFFGPLGMVCHLITVWFHTKQNPFRHGVQFHSMAKTRQPT